MSVTGQIEIKDINVTLGMSLLSLPIISLFEGLFRLYINSINTNSKLYFFYKNIFSLIENPYLQRAINRDENSLFENLASSIKKEKLNFVSCDDLNNILNITQKSTLKVLTHEKEDSP